MIELDDLHYRYPDGTFALKGITMTIPDGIFLLLCGPNGSGKTTLIRHFNGLLQPSSGSIAIDGMNPVRAERQVRQRVGMVFQDADSQILGETVREDIAFGPENLGLAPAEVQDRVNAVLDLVELGHLADKPCHLLSGGEKRRVAIAGVLAMNPAILVFDEPFANLDYRGIRHTLQQLVALHQNGHTIIVTTHDVEKVLAHVSHIAILHQGELKAFDTPHSIVPQLSRYEIRPPCSTLLGTEVLSWLSD